VEKVVNWEDEVAKWEEASQERERPRVEPERPMPEVRGAWGRGRPMIESSVHARSLTPEAPPHRVSPWEIKDEKPETKPEVKEEAPSVPSYAEVSKEVERVSPEPSPAPTVPSVVTQKVPKGPWGVKNPRITSKVPYAQVVSSHANQAPTTQAEAKSGSAAGVVTMSLKPRTAMRN